MALPVQSVRAKPEHRELLQAVADLLRQGKEREVRRLIEDASARSVGPFRSENAALGFLVDRLVVTLKPRMLWLFGSRARRDHGPDSDFDVLVVLPDGLPPDAYSIFAVAAPLLASGLDFEVVPCSWADFLREREARGTLVHTVVNEGRILYEDRELRTIAQRSAA